MIDWELISKEQERISQKLLDSSLAKKERIDLQKKHSHFAELLTAHDQVVELEKSIAEHEKQLPSLEDELKNLFEEEIAQDREKLSQLNLQLEELLYPGDERDVRPAFLEIRAGAGGQEASLFVADLLKMYINYAMSRNWEFSVISAHPTDVGGYKEIVLYIKGKNVYRYLKFESGVHRVQRVPKTESAGRVHTSTVTVAVLPEVDEVDVEIDPSDLRVDVYRASGAGGQHVNTTDSAVRITHIPTGIVVTCQDERSQIKNKAKALKVLRARIVEAETQKREEEISTSRKEQVGAGERAEKIRTYNFPQNRVTDHRINLTLKKLDVILEGELKDLIEPLLEWDLSLRRQKSLLDKKIN